MVLIVEQLEQAPWNIAPGGTGSVKVMVSNLDFKKARSIVVEYERNIGKKD